VFVHFSAGLDTLLMCVVLMGQVLSYCTMGHALRTMIGHVHFYRVTDGTHSYYVRVTHTRIMQRVMHTPITQRVTHIATARQVTCTPTARQVTHSPITRGSRTLLSREGHAHSYRATCHTYFYRTTGHVHFYRATGHTLLSREGHANSYRTTRHTHSCRAWVTQTPTARHVTHTPAAHGSCVSATLLPHDMSYTFLPCVGHAYLPHSYRTTRHTHSCRVWVTRICHSCRAWVTRICLLLICLVL
jgi:hypothetical protein